MWKAEQTQAEEDRKLEAWKKDREEERQIMELKRLQQEIHFASRRQKMKQKMKMNTR